MSCFFFLPLFALKAISSESAKLFFLFADFGFYELYAISNSFKFVHFIAVMIGKFSLNWDCISEVILARKIVLCNENAMLYSQRHDKKGRVALTNGENMKINFGWLELTTKRT